MAEEPEAGEVFFAADRPQWIVDYGERAASAGEGIMQQVMAAATLRTRAEIQRLRKEGE